MLHAEVTKGSTRRWVLWLTALLAAHIAGCGEEVEGDIRGWSWGRAVVVLPGGDVCAFISTNFQQFPATANALLPKQPGGTDIYIYGLPQSASSQFYGSYFGTPSKDTLYFAIPAAGDTVVFGGQTYGKQLPLTPGAVDTDRTGETEGWVTQLDPRTGDVIFSTYLGGKRNDFLVDARILPGGDLVLLGVTSSRDFLEEYAPAEFGNTGDTDAFLVRLSPDGTEIRAVAIFGGKGVEDPHSLALAPDGGVIACGSTGSKKYPVTDGSWLTQKKDNQSRIGFLTQFTSDLTQIVWSTFVGGGKYDDLLDVEVGDDGTIWTAGVTRSNKFPVTPDAAQTKRRGSQDVLLCGFSADGSELLYGTYLGGDRKERCFSLQRFGSQLYLAGLTRSKDFPVTTDAIQPEHGGGIDVFLTLFDTVGRVFPYGTYLGGELDEGTWDDGNNGPSSLYVFGEGQVAITVWTWSLEYPTTPGVLDPVTTANQEAGVLTLLDIPGRRFIASTYLTGGPQ